MSRCFASIGTTAYCLKAPSLEQQRLADADDVKLRLGIISPSGQQKGVDSLIVTDLVELARNQAVSDAVLLSGDEDVRIGVQIAQSFGVRVHLIGIEPSRGNQSRALMQEADTTTEWSKAEIGEFLTLKPGLDPTATSTGSGDTSEIGSDTKSALDEIVSEFVKSLESDQLRLIATLNEQDLIPEEHDRLLLGDERTRNWTNSGLCRKALSPRPVQAGRSQLSRPRKLVRVPLFFPHHQPDGQSEQSHLDLLGASPIAIPGLRRSPAGWGGRLSCQSCLRVKCDCLGRCS